MVGSDKVLTLYPVLYHSDLLTLIASLDYTHVFSIRAITQILWPFWRGPGDQTIGDAAASSYRIKSV